LSEESGKLFVHYKKIMDSLRKKDCSYAELIEESIALKAGSGFETLEFIANQFARSVKKLLDSAFDYGVKPLFPIIVTGGQANNPQWMQMKTSIAGVPLATTNCADAELIGNALVAFTSLKMYNSLEDAAQKICRITKVYNP
ncbi:MAG: hypothetical protein IJR49_02275, partial [Treponema sp.]|nr:hypothetical protein [Treponema sp.]